MGPNNIKRVVVQSTVELILKNSKEQPEESLKKLFATGYNLSKGGPLEASYARILTSMERPDSALLAALSPMLTYANAKHMLHFFINFGYNALTYGCGKIKKQSEKLSIPWICHFDVRRRSENDKAMKISTLSDLILQANRLGIYAFSIRTPKKVSERGLNALFQAVKNFKESAFLIMLPQEFPYDAVKESMQACTNTLFLFDAAASALDFRRDRCKKDRLPFGLHTGERSAMQYIAKAAAGDTGYAPIVLFTESPEDHDKLERSTAQALSEKLLDERTAPTIPSVFFRQKADSLGINQLQLGNENYLYITGNTLHLNERTISLPDRPKLSELLQK